MNKKIFILISLISFSFLACEDVIEIDLNSVEPRIVIEAKLFDQLYPATVLITKTGDFFDTISYNTISGAEVLITDDSGNVVNIPESDTAGVYQTDFFGEIGKIYTLTVNSEGETYTSTAEMKPPIKIDSIKAVYHGDEIPYFEEGYELSCFLKDSVNISEYCMLNLYKNLEKSYNIYLYDDTYTDGSNFEYTFFAENFQIGDTLVLEVNTCDRGVYDYLYTYAEIASDFFQDSGTPYNPTSNISNDALGYFGVFSLNGAFMIIEE